MSGVCIDKNLHYLYHKAYIICWKTISKDTFSEKADNLQVDENLE